MKNKNIIDIEEPATILIVEDSPTQQEQLKQLLERYHYRVTAANNGRQALALLAAQKPAAIISDIVMPEMDGYEFCRQVKADKSSQHIPVILLTSLSRTDDVLEGLACGADNFIPKPYSDDYLIASVRQVLANRSSRRTERVRLGMEITFGEKKCFITADQQQMLTLLISTYEAAVSRNKELIQTQEELRVLNEHLEDLVGERTAALSAEVAEHEKAKNALVKSEVQYRRLFEAAKDGVLILDAQTGVIFDVNPFLTDLLGFPKEQFIGKQLCELGFFKDIVANQDNLRELQEKGSIRYEDLPLETADGRRIDVEFVSNVYQVDDWSVIQCNIRDVTERRLLEKHRETTMKALATLNRGNNVERLVGDIISLIQAHTGIEAVGIRLRDGDDFPYYETQGFPDTFVEAEGHLCARNAAGEIVRDQSGNPVLECMCGNVLCGRFDATKPFFTPRGSFWTNSTTELLASTSEQDRQARTCNRCNGEGYESVALIPLRKDDKVTGLMQLNDHRKGMFVRGAIAFYEEIGASIGIALARVEGKDALKRERDFAESMIETAQAIVLVLDVQGNIMRFNRYMEELSGYALVEVQGKNWFTTFLPEGDRERIQNMFLKAVEGISTHGNVNAIVTKDGALREIEWYDKILRDGKDNKIGLLAIGQDVTERKQAEEQLLYFKKTVDSSSDAVGMSTPEGKHYYQNEAFTKLFGFTTEQVDAKTGPQSTVYADKKVGQEIFAVIMRGETWVGEVQMMDKDGRRFDIWLRAYAIKDHQGRILGLVGLHTDITERKQAEFKLQRDNEIQIILDKILRRSLDDLPLNSFLEKTLDLLISIPWLAVESKGAIFVVEGEPAVLILRASCNLAPALLPICGRVPFGKCLCGRAAVSGRIEYAGHMDERHETSYGGIVPHGHYCVPIITGRKTVGVLCLYLKEGHARDNKEEAFLEAVAAVLAGIIERKHGEQERKSLLEQLVRSEKLAAVGELIAGVAHEINNPLTGIVGLSELLLKEKQEMLDDDGKKDLASIQQASVRISKIVKNLLRFSRKEAPVKKNAAVHEIIDTILDIRRYETKTHNIEVVKHYQADLPLIMADSAQLEQVFLNMITNAEYAIRETGKAGTLTIATALKGEHPEGQRVVIEISDTGAGIPEEVLAKIFDPFFTTKPVGKGTGLGLSVSYGIIKEHGGEIYACNRTEGGAAFTIELPVAEAMNAQCKKTAVPEEPGA